MKKGEVSVLNKKNGVTEVALASIVLLSTKLQY